MLCSKDFFNRSKYNNETKEQLWMSITADAHDSICDCRHCYAHLLACIFPLGHTDRNLTINDILKRDYREKCLSGGHAGDAFGMAETLEDKPTEEKEDQKEGADVSDADILNFMAENEPKEEEDTR